jgi:WD40 repeat protein
MVRLWDVPRDNLIRSWQAYPGAVTAVAFSHDGKTLATGNWEKKTRRGSAQLWKTATGEQQLVLEGRDVMTVALSQDGRYMLTGGADKTPRLWDLTSGKQIHLFQGHTKAITAVAFSPDGRTIATASKDHTARIWRLNSGRPVGQPIQLLHENIVSAVAFSPDGKLVVTGSHDKSARLWHTATGRPHGQPLVHVDKVAAVAFSSDGQMVATGVWKMWVRPGEARFWDVATSKSLGPPRPHSGTVRSLAFDGRILLTGSGKDVRFWTPPDLPAELRGTVDEIVCWSRVVTGLDMDPDGVVRVLDVQSWENYRQKLWRQ